MIALVLLVAPAAGASERYAAGTTWACTGGNGARDRAGRLYTPCGAGKVAVIDSSGRTTYASIAPGAKFAYAVAPTPDGTGLYTIGYSSEASRSLGMALQRLRFDASRTKLTVDPTFVPQQFTYAGTRRDVCGRGIATDAYGYVYVSQGGWCGQRVRGVANPVPEPNLVLKYAPTGRLVTQFGDYGDQPGQLRVNMGIDVSPDGRRVWVAEHTNRRVQAFDWQWDGTYRSSTIIDHVGTGPDRRELTATYDVKLDDWGNVFVADTTAADCWKLAPDGTTLSRVIDLPGAPATARLHAISVDARGNVYSPEAQLRYGRATDNPVPTTRPTLLPEPKPDLLAPVLRGVAAPGEAVDASVSATVDATDDVGVTELRTADESGTWGPWRPFTAAITVPVPAAYGTHVTYVQVRDVLGHESEVRTFAVTRRPPPDTTAPVVEARIAARSASSIVVDVSARDDVAATHVRVAGNDGEFGPWSPLVGGAAHIDTTPESGTRSWTRYVEVRDAAWNVSSTVRLVVADPTGAGDRPGTPGGSSAGDRVAPVLRRVLLPARACGRRVVVSTLASDDGSVTQVRFANEDGRYGPWMRYRARATHLLSRGPGRKLVTVQVRDAAGNVSAAVSRRVLVRACG